MVLELQFALFQAPQLQLVVVTIQCQHVYDRVQVAVFHVKLDEAALYFLGIVHVASKQFISNFKSALRKNAYNRGAAPAEEPSWLALGGLPGA
jgi:hypothetical protein